MPKIVLAADHAGYPLKAYLADALAEQGYTVIDLGCKDAQDKVDYPAMSEALAMAMKDGEVRRGILLCGSGVGVCMAANRYPWIRAVQAHDAYLARLSREHNDSNVLCMGARFIAPDYGLQIAECWLAGVFQGERHESRVSMLETLGVE